MFHVPPPAMGTINIGYLISLAMFLPVAGWMGDRFWNKTYISKCTRYIYHCISFMRVRVKYVTLNLFRLLQGRGAGLIPPVGRATLFRTFSNEERPKLSWLLIMLIAFAPALWLVIGGFLVSVLSWWWIFYINIPIGHS
ncbi:MFS transporter [Bacillus sp. J14TS2]|uniref:MFS transporter n=1 Tax=Bacillus sp. J14TS2 TaxID=2807188 RepID=UPI001BB3B89D|nr:MFS transporter [Bacillus sp. J14TS2]